MTERNTIIKQAAVTIAVIAGMALLTGLLHPSIAAEKDRNNLPATTEVEVTYHVDGEAPEDNSATFVLKAKEEEAPMPEGSRKGQKRITAQGEGEISFGTMTFTRPDVYEYEVFRSGGDSSSTVIRDHTKYQLKIAALNTGEVEQIIRQKGKTAKDELAYTDIFEEKTGASGKTKGSAKTGDPFNPIIEGMIFGISLVLLLFLAAKARRRKFR